MTYQTTTENQGDYLCVEISGKRDPETELEEAVSTWAPLLAECRSAGIDRMLIRYRLHGPFSLMHAFELSDHPELLGWARSLRVAVVRLEGTPTMDLLDVETIAVNRGFPLRVFTDEPTALAWLIDTE